MPSIGFERRAPNRKARRDKDVAKRAVANFYYETMDYPIVMIADLMGLSFGRVSQLLNSSEHYCPRPWRMWRRPLAKYVTKGD